MTSTRLSPVARRNVALALADLRDGVASIHIWPMLAWQEIRHRYRRSMLGPFWLTLSTGFLVLIMGPLYGRLFGQDIGEYFPYLATSYVVWLFISSLWIESCAAFVTAEVFIRQIKLPLTVHVLRVVGRNVIIFAHHLTIVLLVLAWFRPGSLSAFLLFPLGLLILAINGIWLGVFLGMVCARFRDIPPLVVSIAQIAFFLTPVMWKAEMLGRHRWVADLNPFFHLLEIVRTPLLGQFPTVQTWAAVAVITLVGTLGTFMFFSAYRARIAYWV